MSIKKNGLGETSLSLKQSGEEVNKWEMQCNVFVVEWTGIRMREVELEATVVLSTKTGLGRWMSLVLKV